MTLLSNFIIFLSANFGSFILRKALVVFPGGFGTLDELFELLTLVQTKKIKKYMPIILYGKEYWNEIVNFEALEKWGTLSAQDLNLFQIVDDVDSAYEILTKELTTRYLI